MKKLAIALVPLAAVGLSAPAMADDTQAWGTVAVTVALGGPWRVSNETVVRTSDAKGLYEVENNLLLGYKVKNVTVAAGYTHDPNYSHGSFTAMEHRVRSQVQVDNFAALGPVKLSGRMRMETRWRDGTVGTGWRLRPYIKASLPIYGKTTLNLSNEPFIDLGRTSFQKTDGLDRMRTVLSVSTPLSKHISLEAGYLNQHTFVRAGADTDDHVAMLSLSATY
ncbi:DUF2490 domain-containing protein [Novosphingobium flavum]|uniref:DUF2490 domain-containing protein n=1 Tax=Novosphingobium flavum TaxID=1778672 RepID=A0A7X1FRC1_9SPHN|nr:DUF2490 domain-containing protein [Novosphingobium flavum]MBC2665555.1 DUF2490 domain-containing protein [Novosphingobium flavum]